MAVLSRLLPAWETPLAPDRGPRPPGHRRQAGVGGQLGSGGEGPAQCLGQEDGGGRDPDPGHGGQDRVKRVGLHQGLDTVGDIGPLSVQGDEPGGPGGAGPPRPRRCRPPSRSASSGPRRPAGPRRHGAGLRASSAWHRYVPCRPSSVRWGWARPLWSPGPNPAGIVRDAASSSAAVTSRRVWGMVRAAWAMTAASRLSVLALPGVRSAMRRIDSPGR